MRLSDVILPLTAALTLGAAAVDAALAVRDGLAAPMAVAPYGAVAALLALVAWLRLRSERSAADARQALERDRTSASSTSMFESATLDDGELPHVVLRRRIEGVLAPLMAPLLAVGLAVAAWGWYRWSLRLTASTPSMPVAYVLGAQSFLLLVLALYLKGLMRALPRLAGPAGLTGLTALAGAVATVAVAVAAAGRPAADRWAGWMLAGGLVVLALESLVLTLGVLYRPRRAAAGPRYESRLAEALLDPAAWTRSLAQALDYQFGFGVSQTWFYRFMERAFLPFAVFLALTLYGLSCLVFLGPDEEAVVERLGRPRAGAVWDGGFHLKWPWPIETVGRVPAKRIQSFNIGFETDGERDAPRVILWTVPHYRVEYTFLVAGRDDSGAASPTAAPNAVGVAPAQTVSASLLSMNIPVEYRVTNLHQYVYGFKDPEGMLRAIGLRAASARAAGSDVEGLMGAGRQATAGALRVAIQHEADRLGLGVEIVFVGVQGIHPPFAVAGAFEAAVGALEEKEAAVLKANAYAARALPLAAAHADERLQVAAAYRERRSRSATADADYFRMRQAIQSLSPSVSRSRLYLDALERGLRDTRKVIKVIDAGREVVILDLTEKFNPDLFDLGATKVEGK